MRDVFYSIVQRGQIYYEEERQFEEARRAEFESATKAMRASTLEGVPFFRGLAPEYIEMLQEVSWREFFSRDEILLQKGDEAHKLYFITKGAVRVMLSDDSDEEMALIEVGEGEMLGEGSMVIDAPHSATVTASEPTEVITLDRKALFDLMSKSPELATQLWHRLAHSLGSRLRHSNVRYMSQVREAYDVADSMLGTGILSESSEDE
jgi:CRP-like cAMP-binding protein